MGEDSKYLFRANNISKTFGAVHALESFRFLYLFYNINYNFQKLSKKDKKIHILLDFLMYATEKQIDISCKIKTPESQM